MMLDRLDHLVLTVRDPAATCDFYRRVLGMEMVTFGQGRLALRFGSQKINLHGTGQEFEPEAERPTPGSGDLCFLTDEPLQTWVGRLAQNGVPLLEARGAVQGDQAWVAAPWDSRGVRPDGTTFPRPGRLTVVLARREGRWLAVHTHFSLTPSSTQL